MLFHPPTNKYCTCTKVTMTKSKFQSTTTLFGCPVRNHVGFTKPYNIQHSIIFISHFLRLSLGWLYVIMFQVVHFVLLACLIRILTWLCFVATTISHRLTYTRSPWLFCAHHSKVVLFMQVAGLGYYCNDLKLWAF